MESMVNARLVLSLESQDLLTEIQCGFRKNRSTLDHLVRFETFIRNAFVQKQHIMLFWFDMEKAQDTTWKHGILSDLWDLGFRGHLPIFIDGSLSDRFFKVPVGSTMSENHKRWVFLRATLYLLLCSARYWLLLMCWRLCTVYSGQVGAKNGESHAIMCQECTQVYLWKWLQVFNF